MTHPLFLQDQTVDDLIDIAVFKDPEEGRTDIDEIIDILTGKIVVEYTHPEIDAVVETESGIGNIKPLE